MITSKVGDFTLLRDEFQPTYMGNKQESLVEVYTYTDLHAMSHTVTKPKPIPKSGLTRSLKKTKLENLGK